MAKSIPKYVLVITEKENNKNRTVAGAAFLGKFGGLNLMLNPAICIDPRVMATCWLNLVPYEDIGATRRAAVEGLKDPDEPANDSEVPIK